MSKDEVKEKSPLGRFVRFNRKLGSGSYKTVWLGFDNDTGMEVAWNIISFQNLDKKAKKRISDEIQMLKNLKHPKIIAFINAWTNKEQEKVCFITERVTGGSLLQYIKRINAPLKLKVIRNWCRQILEGLNYLHTRPDPIIHRDLKCDNIFINGNRGDIVIGDLGLSTTLRESCAVARSIVGTVDFIAPEIYDENYGTSVDIYAFGMVLLEMIGREQPWSECDTPGGFSGFSQGSEH
ncbi:Wnk3 [Symbiodinium sp. CCMP2456]|nr:Wnk3 [Symbiodinium sp. CCMP2456]